LTVSKGYTIDTCLGTGIVAAGAATISDRKERHMSYRTFSHTIGRAYPGIGGALVAALMALGCGGGGDSPSSADSSTSSPGKADARSRPDVKSASFKDAVKKDAFLCQSFAEATISEDDAPEGEVLPAETMTGKSVGKLFTEVKALWAQIPLTTATGKRLGYTVCLDTEAGAIEIELRSDIAPNHVRNFVALARVGYYDGLLFERKHHEESDVAPGEILEYIEAGCPMGSGDENFGSIGYWLKPEVSDRVRHEEGTVGAWHKEEADTAACKFYITLTRAPVMDGNFTVFGKVTRGMDVVREIARRPLRKQDDLRDRPENPVMIKKVTVKAREVKD
jgi:cyclophilin family peptidyl-prolyl cis-trans isomerase